MGLISKYIAIPQQEELQEPKTTSKFTRAKDWLPSVTPPKLIATSSKTPKQGTSSWNILGISDNTSGINFLGLDEEENL